MDTTSMTTIGKTVTVKGEISGDEALTIEGRVEGKITLQNSIYVKDTGVVNADVVSKSITIEGSVSGNIVASEKVEILPDGVMVGDIKAPRVVLNDGALLKGQIEMDISDEKIRAKRDAIDNQPAKRTTPTDYTSQNPSDGEVTVNLFRK
jgi:cytoskeletal protein CcmA (bactofilin family)